MAVAVFLVALVGIDDNVVSIVVAGVTAVAYMFSEAIVDSARAVKREIIDNASVNKTLVVDEEKENANE